MITIEDGYIVISEWRSEGSFLGSYDVSMTPCFWFVEHKTKYKVNLETGLLEEVITKK